MISATLPPHRPAETHVLDILDLLRGGLGRVVGDHCARGWVVAPGSYGVGVVVELGAGGVGQGLDGGVGRLAVLEQSHPVRCREDRGRAVRLDQVMFLASHVHLHGPFAVGWDQNHSRGFDHSHTGLEP